MAPSYHIRLCSRGRPKSGLPPKEDRKLLFDLGWSITWSDNNWSNLETFKLLFDTGHLPYLLEAKKKLNLPEDYPDLYAAIHHPPLTMLILHHISFCSNLSIAAVYLFDVWSVQFSEAFLTHLKDKAPWLIVKFILDFWPIVPGKCV